MAYIQPSKCKICKNLNWHESANLLLHEDLTSEAYQLKGMQPEPPSSSCSYPVECPECGLFYLFECDAHCMEYDIYISRILPAEALKEGLIKETKYDEIIKNLPNELNSKQEDKVRYAARALAYHYIKTNKIDEVIKLLTHKSDRVKTDACYAANTANKEGLDMTPYIDAIISLFYDENGFVADAASYVFDIYCDKECKNIFKYRDKLMNAFKKHNAVYHSINILREITEYKKLKELDITPCVGRLIKFCTTDCKYDYLYKETHEVLTAYVKISKKNAKHFLKEFEKYKDKKFIYPLDDIKKIAK